MVLVSLFLDSKHTPVVDVSNAKYVLVNCTDKLKNSDESGYEWSVTGLREQWIYIGQESVYTHVVKHGHVYAFYTDLQRCDRYSPKLTARVGAAIAGNYRVVDAVNKNTLLDQMTTHLDTTEKMKYKYKTNKDKNKITQFHHLHVRLKDLFGSAEVIELTGAEAVLACYLDRFNNYVSTHATFWVFYYALEENMKAIFINLLRRNNGITRQMLKEEGRLAKQLQYQTNFDMSKFFELNVLENRVADEVDWDAERSAREKPNTVDISYMDVFKHASTLFQIARTEGAKPISMKWDDYWAQRAALMPGGAVHSEHKFEAQLIKSLPNAARNKKGLASAMGNVEQKYFTNRKPMIHSYVSTKYEWGKTRALYGCDFESHVNSDFGLLGCEDTFPSFVPTGMRATPKAVEIEMKPMKGVPFCYDFSDFNSQHSKTSMQAVIDAWLHTYSDILSREQIKSAEWTRDSVQDMYVHDLQKGTHYQANGTLFSGWRLTTFINTALNYAYLANAGISSHCYKAIHNGDDVYASAVSIYDAVQVYKKAAATNVRANATKMNIGTIAEFLRMDMRAKVKSTRQYLTRAIATFVHSRIESEAPYSMRNMMQAYYTRKNEVLERGGCHKIINKLYRKQKYFAMRLYDSNKEVINALETYDQTCGGFVQNGLITNMRVSDRNVSIDDSVYDLIKTKISKGINDYTYYLKRSFPTITRAFTKRTVTSNLMRMYVVTRTTCKLEPVNRADMYHRRAMKGAWRNMPGINLIHKMRMGISNILLAVSHVDSSLANILGEADEPLEWLQLLT